MIFVSAKFGSKKGTSILHSFKFVQSLPCQLIHCHVYVFLHHLAVRIITAVSEVRILEIEVPRPQFVINLLISLSDPFLFLIQIIRYEVFVRLRFGLLSYLVGLWESRVVGVIYHRILFLFGYLRYLMRINHGTLNDEWFIQTFH